MQQPTASQFDIVREAVNKALLKRGKTLEFFLDEHEPVSSVYTEENYTPEVFATFALTGTCFVLQRENVRMFPGDTSGELLDMIVAYNTDGKYVGDCDHAIFLMTIGVTEQVQPHSEQGGTCCIGFNPAEQKWFGWSHRAIYGFGIDSKVSFGDCAYVPKDPEDAERAFRAFWDDGVERFYEETGKTWISQIKDVVHNVEQEGVLGFTYYKDSVCKENPLESIGHTGFDPYPNPFGRGEWVADSMEDAKQMAKDFASGVS